MISPTFPPIRSGGADHAYRLCQHLAERGFEICVITSRIEQVAKDARINLYPVMRTWSWAELPRLLWIARQWRPDVVNIHFAGAIYNDQPMVTFLPSILKKMFGRIRIVTQIEDPEPVSPHRLPMHARAPRRLAAYFAGTKDVAYGYGTILRDSDQIIVLSDFHSCLLSKQYARLDEKCVLITTPPLMRMCVETNGVARQRGRTILGIGLDNFVFAYFGYLYPGKGIETLLHADSDLASTYLRAADASVLPFEDGVMLNRSSFAGVVAHGLPTITTRPEKLEPPFKNGENVLLCEPRDPLALSTALTLVMDNYDLREQLSVGAQKLGNEWFSWESAVERTIESFCGTTRTIRNFTSALPADH